MSENGQEKNGLSRRSRADSRQKDLFHVEPDWRDHWWGMPAFEQKDARPAYRITVNFMTLEDMRDFAAKLGISVTPRTDSTWYPPEVVDRPSEWVYVNES